MSRPIVHILIGPSGCGKSTWADRFVAHYPTTLIVSADHYHMVQVGDEWVYKFDPSKAGMAHSACLNRFLRAIGPDCDCSHVIVDNTNISLWERQNYIQAAINAGCPLEFEVWKVETTEEIKLCAERNRHGVPIGVIADMALRFDFDPEQIPDTRKVVRYHGDQFQTLNFKEPT